MRAGLIAIAVVVALAACGQDDGAATAPLAETHDPSTTTTTQPPPAESDRDVRAEVEQMVNDDPRLLTLGNVASGLELGLRADGEDLAQRVHDRFPDAVRIIVGAFPYPPAADARDRCDALPAEDGPDALGAELTLDTTTGRSGPSIDGRVRVTNHGPERIDLETEQPLTAVLVEPGSDRVVGIFVGAIAGTGQVANLAPGQHLDIKVIVGTANCVGTRGYTVPSGDYEAVVAVPLWKQGEALHGTVYVISNRVPVTIT